MLTIRIHSSTQDGDGMLRAGRVEGKGESVQEKQARHLHACIMALNRIICTEALTPHHLTQTHLQFVHARSSDADGMDADYAPAGFKLRNLGPKYVACFGLSLWTCGFVRGPDRFD
jgi:hypothetical protein